MHLHPGGKFCEAFLPPNDSFSRMQESTSLTHNILCDCLHISGEFYGGGTDVILSFWSSIFQPGFLYPMPKSNIKTLNWCTWISIFYIPIKLANVDINDLKERGVKCVFSRMHPKKGKCTFTGDKTVVLPWRQMFTLLWWSNIFCIDLVVLFTCFWALIIN